MVRRGPLVSATASDSRPSAAGRVAGGILISRLLGLVREASLAAFFGAGPHVDVFRTALRGPGVLQNLLGEQSLSASFIPIYSRLLGEGRREEAGRFAGAIFGLLLAAAGGLTLVGVLLAEPLVAVLSAGYLADAPRVAAGEATVDRFPLAVSAVRIVFPMSGLLVLSAWSLGVLNSHRRFFLPYFAPAVWNSAIIATLWVVGSGLTPTAGSAARDRLLIAACVGALAGGALQFLVQLPLVARLLTGFRLSLSTRVAGVREALRSFTPLLAGRGAVQLSGYLDQLLASFLAAGAQSALGWAQLPYLLPISLFALSVAAAELPDLSRQAGGERSAVARRLERALRQSLYPIVAATVAYLGLGYLVVAVLYRRGQFGADDHLLVTLVLAAYAVGLPASACSRLFVNLFYATGETGVPARIAVQRVLLSALVGGGLMLWLDRFPAALGATAGGGGGLRLGAVGLAIASALAAWYELWRLGRAVRQRLPDLVAPVGYALGLAAAALAAAAGAAAIWRLSPLPLVVTAVAALAAYGLLYLAITRLAGISQAGRWLGRAKLPRHGDDPEEDV